MRTLSLLVLCAALSACNGKPAAPPSAAPSGAAKPAAQQPARTMTGKVLETMDSGGYTYLKVQSAGAEVWAAVPQTTLKVGDTVELRDAMEMRAFKSKTLGRTFDRILFAQLGGPQRTPTAAGGGMAGLPPGHPVLPPSQPAGAPGATGAAAMVHPPVAPPAKIADLKVPKAPGPEGRTVAGVFADAAKLKDKPVVVHGVVVKLNAGIMNKNWVHLRDGTGSAAKKDEDLTVTTTDTVKVGDKVKVRGVVHTNKDFGFGYKYATIVEEAKVTPLK